MFRIDDILKKPNIPITIRFTSDLYKWLSETAEKEDISLNRLVLACCKYAKEEFEEEKVVKTEEA